MDMGISTTSGNSATGLVRGENLGFVANPGAEGACGFLVTEVTLTATTTHYLKYMAAYSGSTPTTRGSLFALRVS